MKIFLFGSMVFQFFDRVDKSIIMSFPPVFESNIPYSKMDPYLYNSYVNILFGNDTFCFIKPYPVYGDVLGVPTDFLCPRNISVEIFMHLYEDKHQVIVVLNTALFLMYTS